MWQLLPDGWVINWALWVEFAQAIAWPSVALIALAGLSKPVIQLLERVSSRIETGAGEISAGPIRIKLESEVDAGLREDSQERGEPEQVIVDDGPARLGGISAITDGWMNVESATRECLQRVQAPSYVRQYLSASPILTFNWMVSEGWIGFTLRDSLKALWEIRQGVLSGQTSKISAAEATDFHRASSKAARSIANAVNYRLQKRQPSTASVATSSDTEGRAPVH